MNERPILEDINKLIYQEEFGIGSTSVIQKITRGLSGFAFLATIGGMFAAIYYGTKPAINVIRDYDGGTIDNTAGDRVHLSIDESNIATIAIIVVYSLLILLPLMISKDLLKIFLNQVPKEFEFIIRRVNEYDKETKKELKRILKELDKEYNCKKDLECIKKMAQEFKVRVKNSRDDSLYNNKKEIIKDIENFENITKKEIEKIERRKKYE